MLPRGPMTPTVSPGFAPAAQFEATLAGRPAARIGRVNSERMLRVQGLRGGGVICCDVAQLVQAWQSAEVV